MQIIQLNERNLSFMQKQTKENVVALGFFDGVHKGHQKVINTAAWEAEKQGVELAVMSFHPHPKVVLSGGKKKVNYIMSIEEKAKVLEILGVDTFYIVEFTKDFSSLSPKEFVNEYLLKLGTIHAVAGYDFTYGKKGLGHVDSLEKDANGKLHTTKISKLEYMNHKISSTRIRKIIEAGNVDQLPDLMGRLFANKAKLGNNNFYNLSGTMIPADGLYEVTVKIGQNIYHTKVLVNQENRAKVTLLNKSLAEELQEKNVTITWIRKLNHPLIIFELPQVG